MSGHSAERDAGHVWGAVGPNAAELWNRCLRCRADEGSIQGRLRCPRATPLPPADGRDPVAAFVAAERALHADGCLYPEDDCTCDTPPVDSQVQS